MFSYSKASQTRLLQADPRLQLIFNVAIRRSKIDFGIADTYRSPEKQMEAFKAGKSDKDGVTNLSKHNQLPSLAVDIYGYLNGKIDYSIPVMCYLAGLIESVAQELCVPIRQGVNWDGDGEMITDQYFDDYPHHELL